MRKTFIASADFQTPLISAKEFIKEILGKGEKAKIIVSLFKPTRTLMQNAKFHAMCGDVAKQKEFMGRKLNLQQWKLLFVSAHAVATKEGADMVPGLEGEFVNLRESTAGMTIPRMASLIEYVEYWGAENGVRFKARSDRELLENYW